MKYLTILLIFFAVSASAQKQDTLTAGDHLVKATQTHYAGLGIAGVGIVVTGLGVGMQAMGEDALPLFAVGGVLTIAGAVVSSTAFLHIGKAGRKLNRLEASITPVGASVRLRF